MARAAIIIDDMGQSLEMARKFMAIPIPITFAVLPYQRHSKEIAELAHSRGHEVILHLPMEPHGYPKVDPGQGALLLSMSRENLIENLRKAIDATPDLSGVNNHMGSRFTEEADPMKTVLEEIHRRGLYFIDSCTSPESAAPGVARKLRLPFRQRDVFLDNEQSDDSIRGQVQQLIRKARVEGTAVAIGHPHESTLNVLRQEAARFGREQVQIVPARDLVVNGADRAPRK